MKIPTWSTLSKIGNSKPAKATILFPIIGYLLIIQAPVLDFIRNSVDILMPHIDKQQQSFISVINLYTIYYGLFFVGASSILFSAFADPIIKKYSTADEYCIDTRGIITGFEFRNMLNCILKRKSTKILISEHTEKIGRAIELGTNIIIKPENETEIRKVYYIYIDKKYVVIRLILCVLYFIGFLLLAAPSIKIFYQISRQFSRLIIE